MKAFLFPGQASQEVGMGRDLYAAYPEAKAVFDEADEILGLSLTSLCFEGPMAELSQTAVTQPAVYTHSVAAARVLAAAGLKADVVAGHSLGEYSALTASGALDFATGLRIVRERGRLMQQAGQERPGAMLAILGLEDETVVRLCDDVGPGVVPANFNASGQVVVSGEAAAVRRVGEAATEAGASRVVDLPVSGAFHSPLMQPAADALATVLDTAEFSAPDVPVVCNVTARAETDPARLRGLLVEQVTAPVRWTESVTTMAAMGVVSGLEVGPGAVLRGLVRRIARELKVKTAGTADEIGALAAGD